MPLLSIVISAYNCESFLAECLDSVLTQLAEDCELIVVDDGSQDSTLQILKEYEKDNDNLYVAYSEHTGASGARNRGLSMARGEYVAFLDCDDCIKDGFLEKSRALLEKHADLYIFGIERAFLSGNSEFWTVENRIYSDVSEFADEYIRTRHLLVYSNCNKFYKRSIIEEAKLCFDESVEFGEDRLFNYQYLTLLADRSREISVITSDMLMLCYIQRDKNSMSTRHIPHYFRLVSQLHETKMQCVFNLAKDATEEERLDFEAYDISREIEKTIDRFAEHPQERNENLPEINQFVFGGPYDDNEKIDVLMVLGSRNCGYKADAASVIGKNNPSLKYIVSGANLYIDGLCSEAEYLSRRLAEYGVSPSEIYIENRARYIKQNLEFSAGILHELVNNGTLGSNPRVGVLTGGFHIPRARILAEHISALKDFELIWFPAYGPATQKDTWFENSTGRAVVLEELRKTVKLRGCF